MTTSGGRPRTAGAGRRPVRVAVAGSTGAVGRHVVDVAGQRGHQVVEPARAVGVDLLSGEGFAERIEGVGAVVDVTGTRTQHPGAARELFAAVGPVSLVPRMRVRPVAACEVATALVGLVESGPRGRAADLDGPAEHEPVDLARRVARARGLGRRAFGVLLPTCTAAQDRDARRARRRLRPMTPPSPAWMTGSSSSRSS